MRFLILIVLLLPPAVCFCQSPNLSGELVWAVRTNTNEYEIHSKAGKDLNIYKGTAPGKIKWNEPSELKKDQTLKVTNQDGNRLYFATIMDKDTVIFSERRVLLTGTPNFRDLGGIKTKDGKTLHWSKVFRCGDMGSLNEQDLSLLSDMKLSKVVDFRSDQEISRSPDKYPEGADIKRIHAMIGSSDTTGNPSGFYKVLRDPAATPEMMDSVFTLVYKNMASSIGDYRPLFDELLSNTREDVIVFHCTAGKDRTGVASALILYALGVPEEMILEEYSLSNLYTREILTRSLSKSEILKDANPELLEVVAGVKTAYLKATFEEIKQQYGSIDEALENEIGLNHSKKQALIAMYTY